MAIFEEGVCKSSMDLLKLSGNVCVVPLEQKPPHSIKRTSGVCIARLSGMANMFSRITRQAIQGLMRFNEAMNEIAANGPSFSSNS